MNPQGMLTTELAYAEDGMRGTPGSKERHGSDASQLQDALAAVRQLASAVIATLQVLQVLESTRNWL